MTEQELINIGFIKQEANHSETGNGYDYYYYILDLCEGLFLYSSDNDTVIDNIWEVKSFDIPSLRIIHKEHLEQLIELSKTILKC